MTRVVCATGMAARTAALVMFATAWFGHNGATIGSFVQDWLIGRYRLGVVGNMRFFNEYFVRFWGFLKCVRGVVGTTVRGGDN